MLGAELKAKSLRSECTMCEDCPLLEAPISPHLIGSEGL